MLVYIASPYGRRRGYDEATLLANTRTAEDAGLIVLAAGHQPIIPVMFHYISERHKYIDEEQWWEWCASYLRRCEVMWRLPGESSGADREEQLANQLKIPVVHSLKELYAFFESRKPKIVSYVKYEGEHRQTGHMYCGIHQTVLDKT